MEPADGIARLGFTGWYERQLHQAHAYLATCFLCIVLVAVGVETVGADTSRAGILLAAALILAAGALGIHSLQRYRAILQRAAAFARAAICQSCRTYGSIRVLEQESPAPPRLKVQCAKCGHAWTMG